MGRELRGVQRQCRPRACDPVPGVGRETERDGPAHGGASSVGCIVIVYGRLCEMPLALRSSDHALRSGGASLASNTSWTRCAGGNLVSAIVGSLDAWLPRCCVRRRRTRDPGGTSYRSSSHDHVCTVLGIGDVCLLWEICGSKPLDRCACPFGGQERCLPLEGTWNDGTGRRNGLERRLRRRGPRY
jgi:hypothetical protein